MPPVKTLGKLQGISVMFTVEQYEALLKLTQEEGRSFSYLVREAVDLLLASRRTATEPRR